MKNLLRFLFLVLFSSNIFAQKKPNILIIISDDHTMQAIGAYGSPIAKTPNIDRIAKGGAVFNRAYVTNSICGPSRAALLSGKYSHKNGFKDNENSNFNFNQDIFVKQLQNNGYQTAWIGKMHLGNNQPQGFDYYNILPGQGRYYNPDFIDNGIRKTYEGYVTNVISDLSEQWLNQRDTNKPFCLIVGHKATHRTWIPDLPDLGSYDDVDFKLPETFYDDYKTRLAAQGQDMTISQTMRMDYDLKMFKDSIDAERESAVKAMNAEQKKKFLDYYIKINKDLQTHPKTGDDLVRWKFQRYMKDYLATAKSLDRNIGRMLDYLDTHQLKDNTIVIYLSDQGFYLGEHGWFDKRWIYEPSFRTPMVMRYPQKLQPNTKIEDIVMNIDIAPTLLEAAGVAIPKEIQGKSFLSILKNQNQSHRASAYYHYYENGEHSVSPHFGIRVGDFKIIRFYKRVEAWELFDLKKDPNELNNIYDTKKGRKLAPKLKQQLLQQIKKYEDTDAEKIFNQKI